MKDDFVWHKHDNEDELFMVFKGTLLMDFRDGRTEVGGRNTHCSKRSRAPPRTNGEIVYNLLFEQSTAHTGDTKVN